jgi:hypothetical protein
MTNRDMYKCCSQTLPNLTRGESFDSADDGDLEGDRSEGSESKDAGNETGSMTGTFLIECDDFGFVLLVEAVCLADDEEDDDDRLARKSASSMMAGINIGISPPEDAPNAKVTDEASLPPVFGNGIAEGRSGFDGDGDRTTTDDIESESDNMDEVVDNSCEDC